MDVIEVFPTAVSISQIKIDICDYNKLISLSTEKDNLVMNHNGNFFHKETYLLDTFFHNSELAKEISRQIDKYVINILGENPCLSYTQSWLNVNPPGTSHHKHTHSNSILSGVLYLQTNEDSGKFRVHRKDDRNICNEIKQYNKYNFSYVYFEPKIFDLFIFPSSLEHSVEENKSNETRISLSFNTFYSRDIKMSYNNLSDLSFARLAQR